MTPWLVTILLTTVPPGHTVFSVSRVEACQGAESCPDAKWSTFYQTWVREESAAEGEERYRTVLAPALERAIESVLCVRLDYSKIAGCVPEPVALDKKTKRLLFGPRTAAAAVIALDTQESGFREDVQVGRGSAKKCRAGVHWPEALCGPEDAGGMGRGPANECGLGQQHLSSVWLVADSFDARLLARAQAGDAVAREEICQSLLGEDRDSVERSFRATLRGLLRAHAHCNWWLRQSKMHEPWDFAMYSEYGTGNSCVSVNDGKTEKRLGLFRSLLFKMKSQK